MIFRTFSTLLIDATNLGIFVRYLLVDRIKNGLLRTRKQQATLFKKRLGSGYQCIVVSNTQAHDCEWIGRIWRCHIL